MHMTASTHRLQWDLSGLVTRSDALAGILKLGVLGNKEEVQLLWGPHAGRKPSHTGKLHISALVNRPSLWFILAQMCQWRRLWVIPPSCYQVTSSFPSWDPRHCGEEINYSCMPCPDSSLTESVSIWFGLQNFGLFFYTAIVPGTWRLSNSMNIVIICLIHYLTLVI